MQAAPPTARRLVDQERRVHRILRSRFTDALLELGVSFAQYEVMELLHDAGQLHPGEIGRRLLVTRQSADHLVHQLRRGHLVETWRLDGGSLGVRLVREGRTRAAQCVRALQPTFELLDTIDAATRTRLVGDLEACEDALRPRWSPWWLQTR
ncbi:MAG: MarR family transcriptional regulator [Actinomycetota bacterium]